MFTQPLSPPVPGPQPSSATPRHSRLRGFSYLRNYTNNHLLSREAHHSNSATSSGSSSGNHNNNNINDNSSNGSSSSSSQNSEATSDRSNVRRLSHSTHSPSVSRLTRSASHTPAASSRFNPNRLTLVSTAPDVVAAQQSGAAVRAQSRSPPLAETNESQAEAETAATTAITTAAAAAAAIAVELSPAQPSSISNMTRDRPEAAANGSSENAPSIRFSAYYDPRSTRPSLSFPPVSRTLPNGTEVIRVGRYSERDTQAAANLSGSQPSAAPVGFKSKVVSRRHCEFWYENGKWFIKDVKSSSGTFLNHIRLSPPSQESKAFPVNDGDIVQLGIDFKGGEEMIFRCVKMRLELNRGWQNKPNSFNIAAHKRLRTIAASNGAAGSSSSSQDCSICLNSIAPCQSLFVAPCSHTWHFKCVRSLLTSPQYPIFICPNCRAGADLEADVEEPNEEWQQYQELEEKEHESSAPGDTTAPETVVNDHQPEAHLDSVQESDAMDLTVNMSAADGPATPQRAASHAVSEPLQIKGSCSRVSRVTPSPPSGAEGPITPRNDAGPWVFDGRGGRRSTDPAAEMRSLDATADMDMIDSVASDDSSR